MNESLCTKSSFRPLNARTAPPDEPSAAGLSVTRLVAMILLAAVIAVAAHAADQLPFKHRLEVYREKDGHALVFSLLLEQAFFAEEFEKSNYLRLQPLYENAYLIYPNSKESSRRLYDHVLLTARLWGEKGS